MNAAIADEQAVLSVGCVSNVLGVEQVACSLPRVVGQSGVVAKLSPKETEGLHASAGMLKGWLEKVGG